MVGRVTGRTVTETKRALPGPVASQHRQADDHDQHDRHVGQNNSAGVVPESPSELRALFENRPIWDHRAHSIVLDACQYWERLPWVATMISAGHGILLALAISHDDHLRQVPWRSSRARVVRPKNLPANTATWYGCPKVAAAQAQVGGTTRYGPTSTAISRGGRNGPYRTGPYP